MPMFRHSCAAKKNVLGTGKTWTMEGELSSEESWGVIPRSAHRIFSTLSDSDRFESSRVYVSYLEVFNEELFDLLIPSEVREEDRPKLRIVEDKSAESRGIYCQGLTEQEVTTAEEVLAILQAADEKRRVEETKMMISSPH